MVGVLTMGFICKFYRIAMHCIQCKLTLFHTYFLCLRQCFVAYDWY